MCKSFLEVLWNFLFTSCFLLIKSFCLPGSSRTKTFNMGDRKILSVILLTSLTIILMARFTFSCNQVLCASIVSKCMLTQSCKCELKNCTCCRDCYQCLSWLWEECCSCVGELEKKSAKCEEISSEIFLKFQIYVLNQVTQRIHCQSNLIMRSLRAFQDYSMPCLKTQTTISGQSLHSQSITTHHSSEQTQKIHNFICVSDVIDKTPQKKSINQFFHRLI